ncbi:MAG: phytanoyl-CoA dioxygenase family protein [Myxococcota bacterium]
MTKAPRGAQDLYQPWDGDNQAWWDWYVGLSEPSADSTRHTAPPLPVARELSDAQLRAELEAPFPLTDDHRRFFRENGYIKLSEVLSAGAVLRLRRELVSALQETFGVDVDGGVQDRFLSMEMAWLSNDTLRAFVLSPRIAGICGRLLGVDGVRLYHDNILSKEPGCGRTPWHYDATHFPLDTDDVVTAWIPAQPIPREMGPLAFARPIDTYRLIEGHTFDTKNTSYDRLIIETLREHNIAVEDGPFALGEVSFHHNLSLHTAESNRTDRSRMVLANTFFRDDARVVERPTLISGDWKKFLPGVKPGELAATELNPICWSETS